MYSMSNYQYIICLQSLACVSVLCSGMVVVTSALFKDMRRKLFMQIITYIALSDLIGNIPYLMSYRPSNGNWWCSLQGFMNLYFYPVSWLWTTMMMYFLYSLASTGKLPLSKQFIHILCWGLPLLFTLLNLTTNTYGTNFATGENAEYEVCTLSGNKYTAELWHFTTYYGLWMFCVLCMAVLQWLIRAVQNDQTRTKFPVFQLSLVALKLYPIAMVVCWLPHVVAVYFTYLFPAFNGLYQFYFVADALKITHGFVTASIFFYKSAEARNRWSRLLSRLGRRACCLPPAVPPLRPESRDMSDTGSSEAADAVLQDFSVEYEEEESTGLPTQPIAMVSAVATSIGTQVSGLLWSTSPIHSSRMQQQQQQREQDQRQSSVEIC